ncbi:MAG: hypothetical protein ACE5HB_02035 [Terriglobia bacterium]
MLRRKVILLLVFLGLVLGVCSLPLAMQAQAQARLSESRLYELLQAETPPEQIIAEIRARGVSFELTEEVQANLKLLKAPKEVVAAITEPGAIEIASNVPGAQLKVDGEERDPLSPEWSASVTGLAPGSHVVALQAEGFVGDRKEVYLRPAERLLLAFELELSVSLLPGPMGTRVNVAAGTSEDSELVQLEFVKETAARAAKLEELVAKYAGGPLELLLYPMLQETRLQGNQNDQAIAAGEKVLERDPRNFDARIRQVRAYAAKGDLESAFPQAVEARKLVESLPELAAPEGVVPEAWRSQKERLGASAGSELLTIAYDLFAASSSVPDPGRKMALLKTFIEAFPDSDYRRYAYVTLTTTAQQQGDTAAALEYGNKGLELDPSQPYLSILVADMLSDAGQDLSRARTLAAGLLERLANQPDQLRPEGVADEQWAAQKQMWEGWMHAVLGQVLMHEETAAAPEAMVTTRNAIAEFKVAGELLKNQPQLYARNLYRLGFAYAKVGELAAARDALQEVIDMGTPYSPAARILLTKVEQGMQRGRR